jgi:hypothetical protein
MINQTFVIVAGLVAAAVGHMLLHDFRGAARAWNRVDEQFPVVMRSSPSFAGVSLLLVGSLFVLLPMCG